MLMLRYTEYIQFFPIIYYYLNDHKLRSHNVDEV